MSSLDFAPLVRKIADHPSYGPAMKMALTAGHPIVLNYHTHGPESGFCVSVCAKVEPIIKVLGGEAQLEELAHIRGFAKTLEDCLLVTEHFEAALVEHYELGSAPEVFVNGSPAELGDQTQG